METNLLLPHRHVDIETNILGQNVASL